MRDQRAEAVGENVGGHRPIAEAGRVIPAPSEPSVVEHEAFRAQRCCVLGEAHQLVLGKSEPQRLPRIEVDFARTPRGTAWQHVFAGISVERLRQRGTVGGQREHRHGGGEGGELQIDFAPAPSRPHLEHRAPISTAHHVRIDPRIVIAAPCEVRAQHFARCGVFEHQPVAASKTGLSS